MISFKQNFVTTPKPEKLILPSWTTKFDSKRPIPNQRNCQMGQRVHPSPHRSEISPLLAKVAYSFSHRGLLPAYFHSIQITGRVYLPHTGAVIFAPTHRSRWDALLVPYAVAWQGCHLHYMVTADEMRGLQGWFIRQLGGFAVDPRSPAVASLRYGIELLHQGQALVIFPEGGQLLENRRAGVNRLYPGLARIAVKANLTQANCDVKIVPIAINYSDLNLGRCDVDIQIGQPLIVSDYLGSQRKHSARQITQDLSVAMCHLSHLSSNV
jgi:1-acyl-sn-glycerol-3-phosphate acyltransferase